MLRTAGRALSAIAPSVAAALAERRFLTPPRHRRPPAEVALIASARARPVRVGRDELVETWRWGRGPAVLLVHGWGGRGSQLGAFVAPLAAQGFSVVAFDAPGHGASPSRPVTVPEMVAALRVVAAEHGPIAGVVAHSAGGVVAARALYEGLAVDAAVLIASAADLRGASESFAGALGLSRRVREAMQARIERRAGIPWSAFEVARLAPAVAVPLLVAHDREDGEVPWHHGRSIAAAWPGAELLVTGGLGHRRILRDPDVVARAVAFVTARVAERGRPGLPRRPAPEPVGARG